MVNAKVHVPVNNDILLLNLGCWGEGCERVALDDGDIVYNSCIVFCVSYIFELFVLTFNAP